MIDFRLYRLGFLPVAIGVIVLAFSLGGVPESLPSSLTPAVFAPREAASTAREIAARAPDREPGSPGDAAIGQLVERRFDSIPGGVVSEQRFDADYEDEDVSLRNVMLTLPGESDETVAVVAARDAAEPGTASSAVATGALLQLASAIGATDHRKTILFVSTDGSAAGGAGAKELAKSYDGAGSITAALVLTQPGARQPRQPFLVTSSDAERRTSLQLVATTAHELARSGDEPTGEGAFTQLARLAFPAGLGEQAPLIAAGLDAVAISSVGERPLPAGADRIEDVSSATLGSFGRAALAAVLALDGATGELDHGPGSYLEVGRNVIPAGTIAFLVVALLVPPALAATDGVARAARRGMRPAGAALHVASLALPPLAALAALYAISLVGLVPRPPFPFDPAAFSVGAGEIAVLVVLAAIAVGGYAWFGLTRAAGFPREALVPAAGAVSVAGAALAWLANPFLAALLVPLAHAWLAAATRRASMVPALLALVVAAAPVVAALVVGCAAIGADPWDLALIVADGQIGVFSCVALAMAGAGAMGAVQASRARLGPRGQGY